jgi:hypothetical protein
VSENGPSLDEPTALMFPMATSTRATTDLEQAGDQRHRKAYIASDRIEGRSQLS